jgi:Family of unknown function (DUF6879)
MHPRMLARDGCSGGTCPAVYDLDDLPDDLVIQGKKASADLLGRLTGLAPDETAVTIGRHLVRQALTPVAEPVTLAELQAQFETFSYSAFRLETFQSYAGTGRDDQWVALLKANRRWGKTHQRIHVITEPLTRDMTEELTAGYGPNVTAGEDIRIVPVDGEDGWPADVPRSDFWLFDGCKLYDMHYRPDGSWAGADRITDPERIVEACRVRDAALHRAVPWHDYIASRPDLKRRVAQ